MQVPALKGSVFVTLLRSSDPSAIMKPGSYTGSGTLFLYTGEAIAVSLRGVHLHVRVIATIHHLA